MIVVTEESTVVKIDIGLSKATLSDTAVRDAAYRAQLISDNPTKFEQLSLMDDEANWIEEKTLNAADQAYALVSQFATDYSQNAATIGGQAVTGSHIYYGLSFPVNFDSNLAPSIETMLFEIIQKTIVAEWFKHKNQMDLVNVLSAEVKNLGDRLNEILLRWKVQRTAKAAPKVEAFQVAGTDRTITYVAIAIPVANIVPIAKEDINAVLKSRPGTQLDYERLKIGDAEDNRLTDMLETVVGELSEKTQAYALEWESNVTGTEFNTMIANLKDDGSTPATDAALYVAFIFKLPATFNLDSGKNMQERIYRALRQYLMMGYFMEIGLTDIAAIHAAGYDNAWSSLISLLHRRTIPSRRSGSFFT